MVRTKFIRQAFLFLSLLAVSVSLGSTTHSAAAEAVKRHEVVFLLDGSHSMNATDPEKLAPDCLEEILYTLPPNYSVGFVAYGSDVQAVKPVDIKRGEISAALRQVNYTGYTNAGAGLEKALTLFRDNTAEKTVILLSDGEIMLNNPAATRVSEQQFEKAVQAAAQRGIRIVTVAVGGPGSVPQADLYASANSWGMLLTIGDAAQLSGAAKTILYEVFGIVKIAVSSGDWQSDTLNVRLPLAGSGSIDGAKVLLTSTVPLGNIAASYTAKSGEMANGKRFALLDLRQPQSETVEIRFGTAGGGNMQADLVLEMDATVQVEVKYTDSGQAGQKLAEIQLIPVSAANQGLRLFDAPYFEGKSVRVEADGQEFVAIVERGALRFSLPDDIARSVDVRVHYEDLGVNIIAPDTTYVQINRPEGNGKMIALAAAILIAIFAVGWWRTRKPAPAPPLPLPPPPTSRYEYAGKLKIFVTQAPDDSDVAPMEYNLYRHFRKEELSLGDILKNCGLTFELAGAHKVFFSPGVAKALVLTNMSDCTILKNRDLLVKDHSCLVNFNERIHITFEDERSELILEYKNVKPSERR